MFRVAALALAILAPAAPASAAPVDLGQIAGAWVFETAQHAESGCIIRGEVAARPNGAALAMDVRVHETCPNGAEWRATETCVAQLQQASLVIRCFVVSAEPANYVADQFILNVESAAAMSGRLIDGGAWDASVRWRRPEAQLVS